MHNRYSRIALFAAIALVATGCNSIAPDAAIVAPDAPTGLKPLSPRMNEAGGGGDLAVSIQGLRKFRKETLATYRVEVSGGQPPYYYYWTEQVCWYPDVVGADGFSSEDCREYSISANTAQNTLQHLIRSDFKTARLHVQVRDSQGAYVTGNHAIDIFAPGFYAGGTGGGSFSCGSKVFPFKEFISDGHAGEMYDRSSCDGHKIYQPQYPNGPA